MLKRIFIDNYKCCVNLDVKFDSINLLMGENGVGKSTIFEILYKLQALVCRNDDVSTLFDSSYLTRWQTSSIQKFEIEFEGNEGTYLYELDIEFNISLKRVRIRHERLWYNQNKLIDFQEGTAKLYRDNYSEGPEYPFDWTQSAVGALPARHDNTKLTWFKERLKRLIIVQINPVLIGSESSREADFLDYHCNNFVAWYRTISEDQGKVFEITNLLKNVIDGFDNFVFKPFGEHHKQLNVQCFKQEYRFHELSDGQRTLIILYMLVCYTRDKGYTLCIDEPENYVSLPEIQPWMLLVRDCCTEENLQAILTSHHPEYINYLAESTGIYFERQNDSPVRISAIPDNQNLEIADLAARGWINE